MSQHSFSIADEAGAAYRADVNNALQALVSFSRGATEPSTKYVGQEWDDTTALVKKRRNAANSAWLVVSSLDEVFVVSRSSNTILGVSDVGKTFVATGTFTQTLTAVATLADGWFCFYRNDGSGVITLDPNASETIDGGLVLTLNPGEGCRIACNGSAFKTQGLAWKIIKRKTADESVTSSTTLQDDDHLTFPIAANEEWVADFDLYVGSSLTTTGIKLAVTSPSGSILRIIGGAFGGAASGNAQSVTTSGVALTYDTTIMAAATVGYFRISYWVLNGATPGNITLQFAQTTSSGTATTLFKGSHMQATRIA